MTDASDLFHLMAGGVSVVVDARGAGVPAVIYWGKALGDLTHSEAPASETGSRRHPRDVRILPQAREFH